MNKDALYRITRRVYRSLKDPNFIIKLRRMKDCQGKIDPETLEISLTPDCQLIPTIIHEVIHSMNMLMEEKHVLALEREVMAQLSHKQMANIVVATGLALQRDLLK